MNIGYAVYQKFLEQLLDRLRNRLGEDVILAFALLGSVARGEARVDSDIDLLIVHKEVDFDPTREFVKARFELQEESEYKRLNESGLNPYPSAIFMTERELWEYPLILLDIIDHGLILYDTGVLQKRFNALRKRLAELGSKKVVLEDGTWYWDLKPDWKPGEVIEL
jgi:predicted nucleotidyltransferase